MGQLTIHRVPFAKQARFKHVETGNREPFAPTSSPNLLTPLTLDIHPVWTRPRIEQHRDEV